MPTPEAIRETTLAAARHSIASGDLLLFRGAGLFSAVIRAAGRSVYSHAARVVTWGDDPFCCEVREWLGGRAVTLASQVERFAGRIDVYESNANNLFPNYDRSAADCYARRLAGCHYGWRGILTTAALHTPLVRLLVPADFREADDPRRLICSQACALADQFGGADPVPNLPARLTEPGDLARSPFYRYRFTLTGV